MDAFLLSPVQRLARYPLLVKAIVEATEENDPDYPQICEAMAKLTTAVRFANDRMTRIEEHQNLVHIDSTLDYSRLSEPIPLVDYNRALLRRGRLDLVTISNKKITKSKQVEFMLFTDLLLYAKPVKVRRTGKWSPAPPSV